MLEEAADLEPFRCDVAPARDRVVVQPAGDLDLANVPVVADQLRALREAGWDSVVLDLREVTFADSSALRLILDWTREAADDGFDFRLVAGPPNVQRLFEVSGATPLLTFADP